MSELTYGRRDRNLGVLLHLSSFAGIIAPYAGFVVPVIIWLVYKESDFVNRQGFIFFNGLISYTIYGVISGVLCFILIGFPLLFVSIYLGHLGAYQSGACGPGRRISRIPPCNQVLPNELIHPGRCMSGSTRQVRLPNKRTHKKCQDGTSKSGILTFPEILGGDEGI